MEWIVAVITMCSATVIVAWLLRDIRKENRKSEALWQELERLKKE